MKERPILFSAPMVNAILNGTKTQTRRVVKAPNDGYHNFTCDGLFRDFECDYYVRFSASENDGYLSEDVYFPYGKIGDQLWVRETWHSSENLDLCSPKQIANAAEEAGYDVSPKHPAGDLWYAADCTYRQWGDRPFNKGKTRVSIHMPRWASRIQLEITDIRVERLQEISREDAIAEGCANHVGLPSGHFAEEEFSVLWRCINGAESWAANPWVWVIEFKVIKP